MPIKKLSAAILLCFLVTFSVKVSAQALSGTYTVASLGGNYTSIANAITDLNSKGISGDVTISVPAGWTETAPSGGIKLTTSGASTKQITIQKSGSGANPVITAYTGGTFTVNSTTGLDGIFRCQGVSYLTIDGIDLAENAANTTPATMMEFGYGFFKASASIGCSNNTIKNCNIVLNRANFSITNPAAIAAGSMGILFANTLYTTPTSALTITSATGLNSNNLIINNKISNVYAGIFIKGFNATSPYLYYDQGNVIGRQNQGNTITNFGGDSTGLATYGIYLYGQAADSISGDTINNTANGGKNAYNAITGIYQINSVNASVYAGFNYVNLTQGSNASLLNCINLVVAGTGTITIDNNKVGINSVGNPTGLFGGIYNQGLSYFLNITNNTFLNSTVNTTNSAFFIETVGSNYGTVCTHNQLLGLNKTAAGNSIFFYYNASGANTFANTENVSNNYANNIYGTGATILYGIYSTNNNQNKNFSSDTFTNISSTGGNVTLFYLDKTDTITNVNNNYVKQVSSGATTTIVSVANNGTNELTLNVNNNTFTNCSSTAVSGSVIGINLQNTTLASANVSNNILNSFSSTGTTSPQIYGIKAATGPKYTIDSNNISYFSVTTATNTTSLWGISSLGSGAGKTTKIFGNNIYNFNVTTTTTNLVGVGIQSSTASSYSMVYSNTIYNFSGSGSTVNNKPIFVNTGAATTATNIYSNIIYNISSTGPANSTGNVNPIVATAGASGSQVNIFKNRIYNVSGTSTITLAIPISLSGGVAGCLTSNIDSNYISNITGNKTIGIYVGSSNAGGPAINVYSDTIRILTGTTYVYGINQQAGTANNAQYYNNYIYNLSGSLVNSVAYGMYIQAGAVTKIINNVISDLKTPISTTNNSVIGINLTGGTTNNVYFNTVYLKAVSSGTGFGSSALTFTNNGMLDLRNNILCNNSTYSGNGITAALLRTVPTTLGTAPPTSNYAATSNNNAFYAPSSVGNNYTYADKTSSPTNKYTNGCAAGGFNAYRLFMGSGRDSASFFELPPFYNPNNAPYNLAINTSLGSACESGGVDILGQGLDINGNIRANYVGYSGNGSAPDVGAYEQEGTTSNANVTWVGSISTDWNNNYNWCPYAPKITNSVIINAGTTYNPTITQSGYGKTISVGFGTGITVGIGAALYLGDSLILNGTFSNLYGTLVLVGTTHANRIPALTNYNLVMNSTHGATIYSSSTRQTITNRLTLLSGTFRADTVYVTNFDPNAIDGYQSSPDSVSYTSSGFVAGRLYRNILSTGNFDFPVGNYTPQLISLNMNGIASTTYIIVNFATTNGGCSTPNPDSAIVDGTPVRELLDGGLWYASPDNEPTAGNYSVKLNLRGYSTYPGAATQLTVIKRENCTDAWRIVGTAVNATQELVNNTAHAERTALTTFSNFGIGWGDSPLPVKLLKFDAHSVNKNSVHTTWVTATQENNKLFNVQRSSNGIEFKTIGSAAGCGTCESLTTYAFDDNNALSGVSYYRLQMVDGNNVLSYSPIKVIENKLSDASLLFISPNPANSEIALHMNGLSATNNIATVQIINTFGQIIDTKDVSINGGQIHETINLANYTAGMYFVKVNVNGSTYSTKLLLQK